MKWEWTAEWMDWLKAQDCWGDGIDFEQQESKRRITTGEAELRGGGGEEEGGEIQLIANIIGE